MCVWGIISSQEGPRNLGTTIPLLSSSPFPCSSRCTLCQSLLQVLGHRPYVFPIILPFVSFIGSGFVSCIQISHEQSGNAMGLLPVTPLREHLTESWCLKQRTRSITNSAITEESTLAPPDMVASAKPVARRRVDARDHPTSPPLGCGFCPVVVARRCLVKLSCAERVENGGWGARIKERSTGPGHDLRGKVDLLNRCRSKC